MSDYQFSIYEVLREKERKTEKGSNAGTGTGKRKKKRGGTKSTFRVFSRQASNFVFPEDVPRPYPDPSFVVSAADFGKKNKDNTKNLAKMIATENKADEEGEVEDDYKKRIIDALAKLEERGDVYFRAGPDGLDKLSPKMKSMLENINQTPGLVFVYSNFRSVEGIEIFSRVLDHNGYAKYGTQNNLPKYAIYSGTEDEAVRTNLLRVFTNPENKYGRDIKIIMATSAGAEGLNLKNIRQVHIMEPYWNQVRIRQVIGRGVRFRSHIALPPEERNVEVYRYFSKLTRDQMLKTKEKISTDEHIEDISMKKQGIIDELEQCLKEAAVDCMLNSAYLIKGRYKCYTFGTDAKGFAYMPSLKKDLITSYSLVSETKKVKKEYLTAYYSASNGKLHLKSSNNQFYLYRDPAKVPVTTVDIKKIKLFAVDPSNDQVYDYKSTQTGMPLLVGVVNKESQIVKRGTS
jgi:SNF2 family DNA or RNA helicase